MSSSVAFSAASRPGVIRSALPPLVSSHSTQLRSICRSARNAKTGAEELEHTSRPLNKSRRAPLASTRSGISGFSAGREKSFWEAERDQMMQRMADMRRSLAKDPYGGLFGHQVESLHRMDKLNKAWPGFLRSFIGAEHHVTSSGVRLKSHLQDFNFTNSPELGRDELRYDPVSGRMVPVVPQPNVNNQTTQSSPTVDCSPGGELEATFASKPSILEEGQFQPGAPIAQTTPEASLSSQTIDCTPGSELEALFTSNPSSYKDVRAQTSAFQESEHKPNINIGCPPGNELEALFISESIPSEQPHAESFKPSRHIKILSSDTGLESGKSAECSPGSELEALFASKPALRANQSSPLEAYEAQPSYQSQNNTVDCPPGNELEAKFASQTADPPPQASSTRTATSDEARVISDAPKGFTESTVDCPPGSELEANFTANPVSAVEDGQFQPSFVTDDLHTQRANITLDCQPGNELEAMFISKAASKSPSLPEDLGSLQASDIRARYASLDPSTMPKSGQSEIAESSGSEDLIGDYIKKTQTTSAPSAQNDLSPAYRILTYDSSISGITTAESDMFFGVNEASSLAEVFSRLQNPAKFVPYFENMQRDGYEIATGGGDILVFKKTSNPVMTEKDSAVHAEIAQFLRHDSYPTASSTSPSRSFSTNQPAPPPSSNDTKERPSTSSSSTSPAGKTIRRMVLAGSATAASCYALGVVIEYFRTGGQDGRGIDGFTAFESERRHQE